MSKTKVNMTVLEYLSNTIAQRGGAYLILLDPDKINAANLKKFCLACEKSGVDGFLIGGSLLLSGDIHKVVTDVKSYSKLPIIIFPGSISQVDENADALLFLSLISGRNPEHLIGKHVIAAPRLKKAGLEVIGTGYVLIESGKQTTAEYISNSKPIPRNKPEIAAATALAAEYMGMKLIYLEAGSGAELSVPNEMVKMVSETCSIPIIVGGGIRDTKTAGEKIQNGASIIVTGNHFEDESNWSKLKEFADAVHIKESKEV